jgi:hypothetical protein
MDARARSCHDAVITETQRMSTIADTAPVPMLTGPRHEEVLAALHQILQPRTYLEIGIEQGQTLRAAQCPSIAIDPMFSVDQTIIGEKSECLLYRMSSDRFFDRHDPVALLGERIDLAFLDGLHLYEYLLRDFINVERCCRRNSVILLHDCVPTDLYLARRERQDESLRPLTRIPGGWCGDVWKTILILRAYRPDLRIETFDAALTGLVLVTNLDPDSRVLADSYVEAVESLAEISLQDYGLRRYIEELNLRDSRVLFDPVQLARYVWL